MRTRSAFPRALAVLIAAALVSGCGVAAEDRPEAVPAAAAPALESGTDNPSSGPGLSVYFVRGADLASVTRRTATPTAVRALDLLVEGPTRAEAANGIRTALAPEVVGVDDVLPDGTATVSVTRGFTGLTGGNQLLAVAQVVWTLTELPTVRHVRFTVEGTAVEVPTDSGLTAQPVDRDEYRSVTPEAPASSAPTSTAAPDEDAGATPPATTPGGSPTG